MVRCTMATLMADPSLTKLRTPPASIDAERALLGAIMLRPETMHDISTTIFPESFYAEKHREIYRAILSIFAKGNPIDLLSVTHALTEKAVLDRVGGASYVTELSENVPAAGNSHYYAKVVEEKATLRGLINAGQDIAECRGVGVGESQHIANHEIAVDRHRG